MTPVPLPGDGDSGAAHRPSEDPLPPLIGVTRTAYLLTGRGEPLGGSTGQLFASLGCEVRGRAPTDLARLRFADQLGLIREDLVREYWHRRAVLVARSYGAYLLLHTLADLTAFPGRVLLLAPVLGIGRSADGLFASRPPRASRLMELAALGGFAAPAHLEIHIGADDDSQQAVRFAAGIAGAICHVVESAGHRLPEPYVQHAIVGALGHAGAPDAAYTPPDESDLRVPGRPWLLPSSPSEPAQLPRIAGSCPQCGGLDVGRISYGRPVSGQNPQAGVIHGGCCIGPNSPDRKCRRCGLRWQGAGASGG